MSLKTFLPLTWLAVAGLATSALAQSAAGPWVPVATSPAPVGFCFNDGASRIQLLPGNVVWVIQANICPHGENTTAAQVSSDDGLSWQSFQVQGGNSLPTLSGSDIIGLHAVDAQNAWLITHQFTSNTNLLLRTATGPGGFAAAPVQPAGTPLSVRFFSASNGLVATGSASWPLYQTTDGGSSWQVPAGLPAAVAGAQPLSPTLLGSSYWLPLNGGQLLRSTNAGQTWALSTTPEPLNNLTFRDAQHGLAWGASASQPLYRTADGGATWSVVNSAGPRRRFSMTAVPGSAGTFISVGSGNTRPSPNDTPGTAISYDDGQTWQDLGGTAWLNTVAADATGRAWASAYGSASLLRLASSVLATATSQAPALAVYPNPTAGRVLLPAAARFRQLFIYDATGRCCLTRPLSPGDTSADLSSLEPGVYRLQLAGSSTAAPLQQRLVVAP
jgi:hypothetical protein